MAFTDKGIRALGPKKSAYRVYEQASDPGFCIRVTPAGTRTFQLAYTWEGRKRYHRIGTHPTISLAAARQEARRVRALLDQGEDPEAESERRQQADQEQGGTVRQLMDYYLQELAESGRQTREVRRSLERDALPHLGADRPAKDVQPAEVAAALHQVHQRGARSMAAHLRRYLHRAFELGIAHDNDYRMLSREIAFGIQSNPVAAVPADTGADKPGERFLSWDELAQVWNQSEDYLSPPQVLALRLLIASGQRVWEVCEAGRGEFDLESRVWTIPAERVKTRHKRPVPHIVPITDLMAEQIERASLIAGTRAEYLFPQGGRTARNKPMGRATLAHAATYLCREARMTKWSPRDLRRTWKTLSGEAGVPKEYRDRVQNHALSDVSTRHYDRYEYLQEKREALEQWEAALREALDQRGKVVSMDRERRDTG